MDWNRIKTIFIIAFLILDLFLLSQLMEKHKDNPEIMTDTSFEEKLKNEDIDYNALPVEVEKDYYLSADTKNFEEEEIEQLTDQIVSITELDNPSIIYAVLENPIIIDPKADDPYRELKDFVENQVINGENYDFWEHDESTDTITFYQKHNDKFLILNKGAHLVFYLTEENSVVSYEQTMLENMEPNSEEEDVFHAIRALEVLYDKGEMLTGSRVIKAELGYFTLVNMEATQVLTPTWHFIISQEGAEESFYVNAFDLQLIQTPANNEIKLME